MPFKNFDYCLFVFCIIVIQFNYGMKYFKKNKKKCHLTLPIENCRIALSNLGFEFQFSPRTDPLQSKAEVTPIAARNFESSNQIQVYNNELPDTEQIVIIKLNDVFCNELINFIGELKAYNSVLHSLNVNGLSYLENCMIKHPSKIYGITKIKGCTFFNILHVSSGLITIDSSILTIIKVFRIKDDNERQIIDLKNNSKIYGAIIFDSGCGEVWMDKTSEIMGTVQGGVTKFK